MNSDVEEFGIRLAAVLEKDTDEQKARYLIELYKSVKGYESQVGEVASRVKLALSDLIERTGKSDWDTDAGRCYITNPSTSVRYDYKALDALCKSGQGLSAILWPHRTVSERAGSLTIR